MGGCAWIGWVVATAYDVVAPAYDVMAADRVDVSGFEVLGDQPLHRGASSRGSVNLNVLDDLDFLRPLGRFLPGASVCAR